MTDFSKASSLKRLRLSNIIRLYDNETLCVPAMKDAVLDCHW